MISSVACLDNLRVFLDLLSAFIQLCFQRYFNVIFEVSS